MEVIIEPFWADSSSCTHVLSESATVRVNEEDKSLHFETQYVLKLDGRGSEPIACSADSAPLPAMRLGLGANGIEYRLGQMSEEYSVWLGESRIGTIALSFEGQDRPEAICLPPFPTPVPTPTYAGPTSTPWPPTPPFRSPLSPIATRKP